MINWQIHLCCDNDNKYLYSVHDFVTILIVQCNLSTNENIRTIPLVPLLACIVSTNPSDALMILLIPANGDSIS